ncbi:hypothetical protein EB810_08340 [Altererythrobacter sp. FM1]|uniref:Uncharacterized protein n=1 Tax=Tsuneonella flava TaxID=2055955 RepID=A0ABX7K927_9SPHN|nr:hypothetical protein [Tsuneonella flava]QSB43769.1 hypothetical protein IDJ81_10395 [Tsuneonella flava]ROT95120.1 hypothetical protein EB810_08340 [Altererythrobacter sp. FM1]
MSDKDTIARDFSEWQKARDSHAKLKKWAKIVSIVTGLGWLLLIYKMAQTSEMVLRYSTEAQESIGRWTITLVLMTIVSVGLLLLSGKAKSRMKGLSRRLMSDIRTQLENADEGLRAKFESQLRELGG